MQLNEEQIAAVQHPLNQPACLIAGAGSGKTRVLTERVKWLMRHGTVPRRICALTFTNKAAGELLERLQVDPAHPQNEFPRVTTIHSLALSAIRKNPEGFGLLKKVTPLDEYNQSQMMKKIIEREKSTENPWKVLEQIQFHRARGVGFASGYNEEIHEEAKRSHGGYHAIYPPTLRLWQLYEIEKTKNSVVDFDDMIHLVVRRGNDYAEWRNALQRIFEHVLMDEAQDTNPIQWAFVNMLVGPENKNLYVVGDMSQSIYAFNGAVPAILKDYSENWRGQVPTLYRIARNHRSVPEIVTLANKIQSKMTDTIPLRMESWRGTQGESGETKIMRGCQPTDIAAGIAREIYHDAGMKKHTIQFRDNAILVRSAMQIRDIEGALVRLRIPYVVRGGRGLLQTEEIRDLLAYLRLATNTNDFMALVRAVGVPRRGIGEVALEKIRAVADEKFKGDLLQAANHSHGNKLSLFVGTVQKLQKFEAQPVQAVPTLVKDIAYQDYLKQRYKKEPDKINDKVENIARLVQLIEGLVTDNPDMTLGDIVFQLTIDRGQEDEGTGKVTISTIHSAKGLEWKRVYVSNLYEGSLPHKFSMGSKSEIEEERRLFYVACTRARDILVLCIPAMVQQGPNTVTLNPSRFLYEAGIIGTAAEIPSPL